VSASVFSWRYYRDALQDADKALELAQSWTVTYPREAFAFNALGIASQAVAQYDEALAALREAIRLDPKFVPAYLNFGDVLRAQNRFAEARGIVAEASRHGIDHLSLHRMAYLVALVEGDRAAAARHLERGLKEKEQVAALDWEPRTFEAGRARRAARGGGNRGRRRRRPLDVGGGVDASRSV
jgi:tetratricopeptide (TPR) repeat protein